MFDVATARIIEIIAGVGGMAGILAFLSMFFRERDATRRQRLLEQNMADTGREAERRQKLLELENAAQRQDATEARVDYRELVGRVITVVENNSKSNEALRLTMGDVCATLSVQGERAIQVAQGIDSVESKVDETLLKVEGMDERLKGLDTHLRSKLP